MALNKNIMTGNRVIFKIKETIVGFAQNVEFQDDFGLQEVDGLGNLEVQELVVGKLGHSISGSRYYVSGKTLRGLGFIPNRDEWLSAEGFSVEVQDDKYSTLENYTGCKFATHTRTYAKHTVCGENFTIRATHKAV